MRKRFLALFALLMVLSLVAAACQRKKAAAPKGDDRAQGGEFSLEISEPGQLDPAQADDSEETIITRYVFEGLVIYDEETSEVKPGVATKWEANDDNTVWTFTLRNAPSKFSNGEEVTAESFIRGWNRASSPVSGDADTSPLNIHLSGIEGFKKHFGDAEVDPPTVGDGKGLSGLKAIDDSTLEVTLSTPDPEFYIKTGHLAFLPLPSQAAIDGAKPSFSERPIGNGPFMLDEAGWVHDQQVRVVPNPEYNGGREPTSLDAVVYRIFPDNAAAYVEWKAGNLDYFRVTGPAELKEAQTTYKDRFIQRQTSLITYLGVTIKNPPFDKKEVRQAFSLAIDRQPIIDAVFLGTQKLADGWIPPTMAGYRKSACKYCEFDLPKAKDLLKKAGVDPTTLTITLAFNTGAGHEAWTQAVADQLQKNLGVKVNLEPVTGFSKNFIPRLRAGEVKGLFRLGWSMDYPTPQNFLLPLFGTAAIGHDNLTEYSNKEFDALLVKAGETKDEEDRIKVYQDAEDMILEDMPILPMWFRNSNRLASVDKFGGLGINGFDDPSISTIYLKKGAAEREASPSPS